MKSLYYLAPHASFNAQWDGWTSLAIEKGMRSVGIPSVTPHKLRSVAYAGKVLARLRLVRNVATLSRRAYVVSLMHVDEFKLFPASYFSEVIPYAYDCWPYRYGDWERAFRRHDIRVAFFSARQSCEHFAARLKGTLCRWMPEACDAANYRPGKPLAERSCDVLEFGRRREEYHDAVTGPLTAAGYRHEFPAGEATRQRLIELLGDSKISVCFPRTMTGSAFPAEMETLTLRYFEVMASGGLIVGHCPKELEDLYGYNPVVQADLARPFEQLDSILRSIRDYQPLVDKNYQTLLRVGTWERRAAEMLDILRDRGYEPGT